MVSALLFSDSKPAQAIFYALDHGVVCVSLALLTELQTVLNRPKFDRYLTHEEREQFLAALVRETLLVEISEQIRICRDPKDDIVLELGVSAQAAFIVGGDRDLLALHPFRGIPILSPDAFLGVSAPPPGGGA